MFAISYDPTEILSAFATKHGITYDLLSDIGSRVIGALGLLNQHLADQHAYYGGVARAHHYGVPYPGIFILNEQGVVVEKRFEQSYRVRPVAASVLENFGSEGLAPAVTSSFETPELRLVASLDSATYRPYQKLRLKLDFQIANGFHVYGQPIPRGYTPLTVEIDPIDGLEIGPLEAPIPRPFGIPGLVGIPGLDEQFFIYEGCVRVTMPFVLIRNVGTVQLDVRIRYQACSDTECFPPREVMLSLTLMGLDNVNE